MVRAVLDTDVVVAAVRSAMGASRALLDASHAGGVTGLVSVPLFLEYESVLTRPGLLAERGLTRGEVEAVLDGLASITERVRLHFRWRPQLADPDDDMVLERAVNGRAEAIVTFNLKDYAGVPARFGIEAVRPGEMLRRIEWRRPPTTA